MRSSGAPSAVSDDDSVMKISVSPPQPLEISFSDTLGPSPPAQFKNLFHAPDLPPRQYFPAPLHQEKHITPLALFADVSPCLLIHPHTSVPRFNPPWPVLAPPGIFSSAPVAHHKLFYPVLMSQPGPVSSRAPGARPDPSLKLFPAPQMIRVSVQGRETPRLFCCGPSDARALTRCFMFTEMPEQDRNRADANSKGHRPQHSSGKLKKTAKRCKKDLPLQDLPESALTEYSRIMDALGSKVTEGSEVTDEEDVCALFLNQLLDDSQSMTEADLDMDFITSLLSSDVLKENPEAVAGCSDWTRSTGSEAPPCDGQRDSRPFNGTDLLLSEEPMMKNILAPFQDTVRDQTVSQMFTEPLLENAEGQSFQTDLNTSVQETPHPDLQDFAPETDGNLKDETVCVDELDSATHSNCFSLQNYKSHHATFPHTLKHEPEPPQTPVDGGPENDGEENTAVRPEPEKYTNVRGAKDDNKMDLDVPDDFQRTRKYCNKQTKLKASPKIDQIEENNVNKNKKHKRRYTRRNIVLPIARTSSKLDDKVKKRVQTSKYKPGKMQRKSANATKHEAGKRETHFIKINMKRVELQNITEEGKRASLHQQIKKIRGEHLDEEVERRKRLNMVRRVGKQQTTKTERDRKKLRNLSVEEDRGEFPRKTEVRQRLQRERRPKLNVKVTDVSEKVDEMST